MQVRDMLLVVGVIAIAAFTAWKAYEAWDEDQLSVMWARIICGGLVCILIGFYVWLRLHPQVLSSP